MQRTNDMQVDDYLTGWLLDQWKAYTQEVQAANEKHLKEILEINKEILYKHRVEIEQRVELKVQAEKYYGQALAEYNRLPFYRKWGTPKPEEVHIPFGVTIPSLYHPAWERSITC